MSKSFNRIKLALVAVLFAIVYVCVGTMLFAKAEETLSDATGVTTFEMSGAELIVEGDDGVNGLKFVASISEAEYNALKSVDADFETGVVIMPIYYDAFNIEEDMFGENAKYNWAIWNGSSYVYTAEENKLQIVNINANDWVDAGDVMTYSGGIVDIQDHNETIAFTSIAYIKVVDAGDVVSYVWTDMASTSIALEVEKATLTEEQKAWVDANWDKLAKVEADTVLLDVAGKETVGVDSIVNGDNMEGLMMSLGYKDLSVKLVKGETEVAFDMSNAQEDPTVAANDLSEGIWTVEMVVDGVVVYTGLVDIYDSTKGLVWNTLDNVEDFGAYYGNNDTKVMIEMMTISGQATEFDGKEVLEISNMVTYASKAPGEVFMTIAPSHTKEYYAQFVGMGLTLNYSFYYDVNDDFDGDGKYAVNQYGYYGSSRTTGGAKASDAFFNTWRSVSVSLDTVVEDWDNIVNVNDATYAWGDTTLGLLYALTSDLHGLGGMEAIGLKLYVAGFELVADPAVIVNGGEVLIKLDDVADKTALNVASYLKAEDMEALAAKDGVTYEFKGCSIADKFTATDLTAVDVSEVKEAAYILTAKVGPIPVYTATVDLYTSTSPVVWAESMTAENVILRKTAYQVGWPSAVTGTLVAGTDYEFVNSLTIGEKVYEGSFFKVTVKEAMNIALDIKALHTKAYYQEMSDLTKVLHIRGLFPSSVSMGATFSANNYGMNNPYGTWRNSTSANTYESIVISMDNYLIASDNNTASGKYYNWANIAGNNCAAGNTMVQFEIPASKATAEAPFVFYLGNVEITEAGETIVANANKYVNTTIDLSGETTSFDLINVIPENQRAKLVAMAKAWGQSAGKKSASCVGLNLTIGGNVHSVKPDADGKFMLNLDDYVVAADGTVSETTKVRDLLVEGANSVSIVGYAPPVTSMGLGSWPVTMAVTGSLTIVGPAPIVVEPEVPEEPAGFDIKNYEGKYSECDDLSATAGALLTSVFTEEMLADFATLEENGYALTYVIIDANGELGEVYYTAEDIATAALVAGDFELIIEAGDEAIEILFAILSVK